MVCAFEKLEINYFYQYIEKHIWSNLATPGIFTIFHLILTWIIWIWIKITVTSLQERQKKIRQNGGRKNYSRMEKTLQNFAPQKIQTFNDNNRNAITVDSLLILLLGFPSASIISRAYNSLWALLILRSSFQLNPSLLLN